MEITQLISQQSLLNHYEVYFYGLLCFIAGAFFGILVWRYLDKKRTQKEIKK